jgi:hypothetical protein
VTSRDFKMRDLFVRPDPLVVLRDSNDGDKRARALRALKEPKRAGGSDQDQEMVLTLLTKSATADRQAVCRSAAIESLGRFQDPRAVESLVNAYYQAGTPMTAPNGVQQTNALFGVVGFPPDTVHVLRCQTLAALGQTKNPRALEHLLLVLRQPGSSGTDAERQAGLDERIAAGRALGSFDDPQVIEALLRVLETEKDVALRAACNGSLQKITRKKLPADARAWRETLQPQPAKP